LYKTEGRRKAVQMKHGSVQCEVLDVLSMSWKELLCSASALSINDVSLPRGVAGMLNILYVPESRG
jgi:hypothetical protein